MHKRRARRDRPDGGVAPFHARQAAMPRRGYVRAKRVSIEQRWRQKGRCRSGSEWNGSRKARAACGGGKRASSHDGESGKNTFYALTGGACSRILRIENRAGGSRKPWKNCPVFSDHFCHPPHPTNPSTTESHTSLPASVRRKRPFPDHSI